jgi:hypothetical protein
VASGGGVPLVGVGAGEGTDGVAVVALVVCVVGDTPCGVGAGSARAADAPAGDTPGGGGGLLDTAAGGGCGAVVKVDVPTGRLIGMLLDAVTGRLPGDATVDVDVAVGILMGTVVVVAVAGLRMGGCAGGGVGKALVAVMPCAPTLSGHAAPKVVAIFIASIADVQAAATAERRVGCALRTIVRCCIIFAPSPPRLGRRAVGP